MKRLLLVATTMLLAVSCIKVVLPTKKGAEAEEAATETEAVVEAVEAVEEVAEVVLPKVYSNAYDGYLNVRAQPTTKSQVVGKLNNGPEGAELLGVEGKWSKVRVNGVEGYVSSAYVQSTPTQPVYINANAILGMWSYDYQNSVGADGGYCIHSFSFNSNGNCYVLGMGEDQEITYKWRIVGSSLYVTRGNQTYVLTYNSSSDIMTCCGGDIYRRCY